MRRFQLYLRLIDIAFWLAVLFFARLGLKLLGILPAEFPHPIGTIYRLAVFGAFLMAPFLVCARFMRDEHAERIWQLAAQRFVYFLVLVPSALGVILASFEPDVLAWVAHDPFHAALASQLPTAEPVQGFVEGVGVAIILLGIFGAQVFIAIYKYLLWRDAR